MKQDITGLTGESLEHAELIYRADIQFIDEVDFGIPMQELISGQRPIPPMGARFDQTFKGELQGPRIHGSIEGTDYLRLRADGCFQLHLHARVTTQDGATIAMASEGVSLQGEGSLGRLRSTVTLHSADERYGWVNGLQLWALGVMDPSQGRAILAAYSV